VGFATSRALGGTTVFTISSLLSEHVTLQVRSVDRIFLAGYVPRLQCDGAGVQYAQLARKKSWTASAS
jgi:hypothetical protein